MQVLQEILVGLAVLVVFAVLFAVTASLVWRRSRRRTVPELLKRHFFPTSLDHLTVTERRFPTHIRADLQRAIDEFLRDIRVCSFHGVQSAMPGMGGVDFTSLLGDNLIGLTRSSNTGPPQYEQIDIGADEPIQVLKNGMWMLQRDRLKFALLYAPVSEFGERGVSQRVRFQLATAAGNDGQNVTRDFFRHLESEVRRARCYRGKVLSLEPGDAYSGQASGVKVHRLSKVKRDAVILPKPTLDLLDHNVIHFVARRHSFTWSETAPER